MLLIQQILCLLIVCATLMHPTDGALWREENIREMKQLKECFGQEHTSVLLDPLFPPSTLDHQKREAIALDTLGRLVKSGRPFCNAYAMMAEAAERHIENQMSRASDIVAVELWPITLEQFKKRSREGRERCMFLQKLETGPLSTVSQCISRVFHRSAKALIVAQHATEEKVVKQMSVK